MKDENGDKFEYWQITGLLEGDTSQTMTVKIETPVVRGRLSCEASEKIKVWARIKDIGDFVDLNESPIDLSGLPMGWTDFEVYVEALSPIIGLDRVPMNLNVSSSGAAGWL